MMIQFVTYVACLCFCMTFVAAEKVSIPCYAPFFCVRGFAFRLKVRITDKNFNWEKVDLGARLQGEKITMQQAEHAVTALIYAPGAATEHNAIAICEKGIFGLQNQVQIKLLAEREAATSEADAAARLAAVRKEYTFDLINCVREAAQHSNVRDALNKALSSAQESNIQVDPIATLEQQKRLMERAVTRMSGGNVSLTDDDSGNVNEVVGSGNSSETVSVSVNSDGKPDGSSSELERIASGIRTMDTLIKALREGETITSDSYQNALAELKAAHVEATAALPTAVVTELLANAAKRNTHIQSPAERLKAQQQTEALRRRSGQLREKPRKAAAVEEKQDMVLELLDELAEPQRTSNKRRVLGAQPDDSAELTDTVTAAEQTRNDGTDGAEAQLLSDGVQIKASDSDKAATKWGYAVLRLPVRRTTFEVHVAFGDDHMSVLFR
jgi:hypothetical protein